MPELRDLETSHPGDVRSVTSRVTLGRCFTRVGAWQRALSGRKSVARPEAMTPFRGQKYCASCQGIRLHVNAIVVRVQTGGMYSLSGRIRRRLPCFRRKLPHLLARGLQAMAEMMQKGRFAVLELSLFRTWA